MEKIPGSGASPWASNCFRGSAWDIYEARLACCVNPHGWQEHSPKWLVDGCGSKICTQNGIPVDGNMDQNPRSPGGLILTHIHMGVRPNCGPFGGCGFPKRNCLKKKKLPQIRATVPQNTGRDITSTKLWPLRSNRIESVPKKKRTVSSGPSAKRVAKLSTCPTAKRAALGRSCENQIYSLRFLPPNERANKRSTHGNAIGFPKCLNG